MNQKNKIKFHKGYIISRDKDENDLLDAKEYFEEADKYLNVNPKILIGVSPHHKTSDFKLKGLKSLSEKELEKTENNNNDHLKTLSRNDNHIIENSKLNINEGISKTIVPKTTLSLLSLKEKLNLKKEKLKNGKIKLSNILNNKKYNLTLDTKISKDHIHYQFRSLKDLKKIFQDSLEREKHFKTKGTNDLIPLKTDINIKKKYFSQEKRLKYNQTARLNTEKYLKYLAKKCKKDENELLINNIEDFRLKKQLLEYIENNKILSEKFGDNYWLFSLRRSDKNDFIRYNYFNIGNNNREIWKKFIDYPDKDVELTNDPYNQKKNKVSILKNFNKAFKNKIEIIPNIKGFNEIKIEGKNLVNKEFNDIMQTSERYKNNCKFKLYKDPREKNQFFIKNFTCRESYKYNSLSNSNNNRYNSDSKHKNKINKCFSDTIYKKLIKY